MITVLAASRKKWCRLQGEAIFLCLLRHWLIVFVSFFFFFTFTNKLIKLLWLDPQFRCLTLTCSLYVNLWPRYIPSKNLFGYLGKFPLGAGFIPIFDENFIWNSNRLNRLRLANKKNFAPKSRCSFLYISLRSLHDYHVELLSFTFSTGTWTQDNDSLFYCYYLFFLT